MRIEQPPISFREPELQKQVYEERRFMTNRRNRQESPAVRQRLRF
jgi:hypothetical protein